MSNPSNFLIDVKGLVHLELNENGFILDEEMDPENPFLSAGFPVLEEFVRTDEFKKIYEDVFEAAHQAAKSLIEAHYADIQKYFLNAMNTYEEDAFKEMMTQYDKMKEMYQTIITSLEEAKLDRYVNDKLHYIDLETSEDVNDFQIFCNNEWDHFTSCVLRENDAHTTQVGRTSSFYIDSDDDDTQTIIESWRESGNRDILEILLDNIGWGEMCSFNYEDFIDVFEGHPAICYGCSFETFECIFELIKNDRVFFPGGMFKKDLIENLTIFFKSLVNDTNTIEDLKKYIDKVGTVYKYVDDFKENQKEIFADFQYERTQEAENEQEEYPVDLFVFEVNPSVRLFIQNKNWTNIAIKNRIKELIKESKNDKELVAKIKEEFTVISGDKLEFYKIDRGDIGKEMKY